LLTFPSPAEKAALTMEGERETHCLSLGSLLIFNSFVCLLVRQYFAAQSEKPSSVQSSERKNKTEQDSEYANVVSVHRSSPSPMSSSLTDGPGLVYAHLNGDLTLRERPVTRRFALDRKPFIMRISARDFCLFAFLSATFRLCDLRIGKSRQRRVTLSRHAV
jgi:hypothetical protein